MADEVISSFSGLLKHMHNKYHVLCFYNLNNRNIFLFPNVMKAVSSIYFGDTSRSFHVDLTLQTHTHIYSTTSRLKPSKSGHYIYVLLIKQQKSWINLFDFNLTPRALHCDNNEFLALCSTVSSPKHLKCTFVLKSVTSIISLSKNSTGDFALVGCSTFYFVPPWPP